MKHRRAIAVVTGTRAEYGLLTSVLSAIRAHPRLTLQLVVTGMHLLDRFGSTIRQIRRDGWRVDARVPMQRGHDDPLDQALGLSRGVAGIARFLHKADSDLVVVLGDRIEALAGALAAVSTGRFLAHVHGGDVAPGDCDDSIRHAITKLAHVHFPASAAAAERIIRMGEDENRVFMVGAPGLDRLRELVDAHPAAPKVWRSALIVQHPTGRTPATEATVMKRLLVAAQRAGLSGTIILPNTDRGSSGIVKAIEDACQTGARSRTAPRWEVAASLPRDEYLRRLISADVLIGNSSSGIIEAGVAGTAVVNVGDRQRGRDHDNGHVIHCGETAAEIERAIRSALGKRVAGTRHSLYGTGQAGPKIADVLADIGLDDGFRRKSLIFQQVPGRRASNGRRKQGR